MAVRASERVLPQTFTCIGCSTVVIRTPPPAHDCRREYCSSACMLRAWRKRNGDVRRASCKQCGSRFVTTGSRYCSQNCKSQSIANRQKPKQAVTLSCAQCGSAFVRPKGIVRATCSSTCRSARLRLQLTGKKYRQARSYARTCALCSTSFTAKQKQITVCQSCRTRAMRQGRGKYRERCKRAGVPYDARVTPLKVFSRDGWRCHLCACRTPSRLRGKNLPTSPELDHIIPIAQGGGHTWDNVACSCRCCNIKKGSKLLVQLRLAV